MDKYVEKRSREFLSQILDKFRGHYEKLYEYNQRLEKENQEYRKRLVNVTKRKQELEKLLEQERMKR